VTLDARDEANGEMFWDDGDSLDTVANGEYHYITFNYSKVVYICCQPVHLMNLMLIILNICTGCFIELRPKQLPGAARWP
jgi:hypothetical protein